MKLSDYIKLILSYPPHIVVKKGVGLLGQKLGINSSRRRDLKEPTYADNFPQGPLDRYFNRAPFDLLRPHAHKFVMLSSNCLSHSFDLLGSGLVEIRHGMECKGVEGFSYKMGKRVDADREGRWLENRINKSNLKESKRVWKLIDKEYIPVDWHLDFKSGYRWTEDTWYRDIKYGHKNGVDVKVPWELSRMQHLTHLAWAYALASHGEHGLKSPPVYLGEFRNELLDFIATNPPRFGVNWNTTMDVAIRVSNWLAAYDLFRAYGEVFDTEFEKVFLRSVYEHGLHIVSNLEWSAELRSNHYLANIAGLLFASAYLPPTPETKAWLSFSVQELVKEVGNQFNADGANFEAATSYHRLSAEMVAYSTALVLGLHDIKKNALVDYDHNLISGRPELKPAPIQFYTVEGDRTPFPPSYIERLYNMAEFTVDISAGSRIAQIGDNDSGRFLKLDPAYRDSKEDVLDHRHLAAAINGLFDQKHFYSFSSTETVETEMTRGLAKGIKLSSRQRQRESPLRDYPDFGLYIYRYGRIFFAIRCGQIGQNGYGGHAHNDQLSFEFAVDGIPIIVDPGTYLYTALPERRNTFRSTAMHNTLAVEGREQGRWIDGAKGLFRLLSNPLPRVMEATEKRFIGEHRGFGQPHRRTIIFEDNCIKGIDEYSGEGKKSVLFHLSPRMKPNLKESDKTIDIRFHGLAIRLTGSPGAWFAEESLYSPSYGEVEQSMMVCLRSLAQRIEWEIRIR